MLLLKWGNETSALDTNDFNQLIRTFLAPWWRQQCCHTAENLHIKSINLKLKLLQRIKLLFITINPISRNKFIFQQSSLSKKTYLQ